MILFLVLVLIFCLGIEKGKKSVRKIAYKTEPTKNFETKPNKNIELKEIKVKATPFLKVYTIQLATYKSEKYANQELKKLQGYDAWIKKRGAFWVLYAGKFKSQKEAQGILKKINRENRYKDVLLKKISQ